MGLEFKLAIAAQKGGKTYKFELKGPDAEKLVGKKIGEKFNGAILGATGFEFEITGGSDKSGFPMVKTISGSIRKTPLLAGGIGYRPKRKGVRRRKTVVGNTISDSTNQINCKVVKAGKNLELALGIAKTEEKPAEGAEEKKEEKPKEEAPKPEPKKEEKAKEKKEEPKAETKAEEPKSE